MFSVIVNKLADNDEESTSKEVFQAYMLIVGRIIDCLALGSLSTSVS